MTILKSLTLPPLNRIATSVKLSQQARLIHQTAIRMAVNPKFPGHKLTSTALELGSQSPAGLYNLATPLTKLVYANAAPSLKSSPHSLELYLDYVCPFSKKQFMGLFDYVKKHNIPHGVQIIFRHQVQPWHPSSTLVHEAALATATLGGPGLGEWFWAYSHLLFQNQGEFFDVNVVNETRNQTYERLVKTFAELISRDEHGVIGDPVGELRERLLVGDKPGKDGALNVGNQVTDDLKLCVKLGRQTGIHVSPTVLWDGLVENSVSSSFGEKEWIEFFEKHI